jgi:hypothetical protein
MGGALGTGTAIVTADTGAIAARAPTCSDGLGKADTLHHPNAECHRSSAKLANRIGCEAHCTAADPSHFLPL